MNRHVVELNNPVFKKNQKIRNRNSQKGNRESRMKCIAFVGNDDHVTRKTKSPPNLSSAILFFTILKVHTVGSSKKIKMADWGPVLIGVVLFVLLQPGLLFQLPGNGKQLEFGSMKTNGKAIAVHTLIFFVIYAILVLALHVHIYTG